MPRKILVVDDLATNRIIMKVKLIGACYEAILARDGIEAVQFARSEQPDLILLDHMMPEMDGLSVVRTLRGDPRTQAIPIIMISAGRDEDAKLAALRAGVDDYLVKPIDDEGLLARIRNLLRASDQSDELRANLARLPVEGLAEAGASFLGLPRIALVSPRPERAAAWRQKLGPELPASFSLLSREEAIVRSGGFDLYFIAADQGNGSNGLQVISELHAQPGGRHATICFVVPAGSQALAAMALDLGANAVLTEDFNPAETALRVRHLLERKLEDDRSRAAVEEGLRQAVRDPLTGLYNRRFALPRLAQMLADSAAARECCTVMMVDIDHFKRVNDQYGHTVGDIVLTEVAARLRGAFRPDDLIARIGGDEFLIAVNGLDPAAASELGARLCKLASAPIRLRTYEAQELPSVTVSIGIAVAGPQGIAPDGLFETADRALMIAKQRGRNRSCDAPEVAA
jgi:two-component system cell cycle response regulator